MNIQNYVWDKQNHTVSWSFNGNIIKKSFGDMHFAYLNKEENFVLLKVGKNFIVEQVYYISFEGQDIFIFDKVNGKISWQYNNHPIDVSCKNVENAQIYFNKDIVVAIIAENQSDKKIKGFALDGKLLFEKEPPEGYVFKYLSTSKNLPTVVCDGGDANADAYGRSEFHFIIDTKTGDMSKVSLAY